MPLRVNVLLDSISRGGFRLLTFRLEFPRVLLAEWNTHRVLSRNAASSRAVPFERMVKRLYDGNAYFPNFGVNKGGMQASEFLTGQALKEAAAAYKTAMENAVGGAVTLANLGVHKQDVNRVIEPYTFTRVVATSTEWDNFLALRTDFAAYPPFRRLARAMAVARSRSTPKVRGDYEWHLPFARPEDWDTARDEVKKGSYKETQASEEFAAFQRAAEPGTFLDETLATYAVCRWSAARCARTSYETHEKKAPNPADDEKTYSTLMGQSIKHPSPCEHQGRPMGRFDPSYWRGNFAGWVQFRKLIPRENITQFAPDAATLAAWASEVQEGQTEDVFGDDWGDKE